MKPFRGSLSRRVALATTLAMIACLVAAGIAVDVSYGLQLRGALVRTITAQGAYLAHPELSSQGVPDYDDDPEQHPVFLPGPQAAYYQLWSSDGRVLARSPSLAGHDLLAAQPNPPNPHETPVELRLPDGRAGLAVYSRLPDQHAPGIEDGITLALAVGTEDVAEARQHLRLVLVAVGLATAVVGSLLVALVARHAMRPLSEVTAALARRADSPGEPLDGGSLPSELRPLVHTLDQLIARLEASLVHERRFTDDAAHELQTPLAAQRLLLELALAGRDPALPAGAAQEIHDLTMQMHTMVGSLLALARLDAGLRLAEAEAVAVGALLHDCWRHHQSTAAARGQVAMLPSGAGPVVASQIVLLRQLIANLFDNAVEHGSAGGRITVSCGEEGPWLVLTVSNPGCRLATDDLPRLFDRFWRGGASRAEASRHAGLGLPLCRRLAEALGGRITAAVDVDRFTVTVRLPLRPALSPGRGPSPAGGRR